MTLWRPTLPAKGGTPSATPYWLYCQAMASYDEIWFQLALPRRAWDARVETRTGTLTIAPGVVGFRDPRGSVDFEPVLQVAIGRRGSDFINRWIEITYGDRVQPSTAFINDGRWRGWRPILTRSNRKILRDLSNQVRE